MAHQVQTRDLYTGRDQYVHMDVRITKGLAKGHFGVILSSRRKDNELILDVRTTTCVTELVYCLMESDVLER